MKKRFILLLLLTLSVGSIFAQTRNTSAFFNAFLLTPPGPGGTGTCLGVIRFEYRTCAGVIFVTINGNATWCCVGCECSFASDFGTGIQDRSFAPGEYDIEAEFCCRPGRNSGCNVLPQGSVALFHVSIPNVCCQSAADCDDGNACNGSETCNNAGFCQPGTELVCDDDNVCNGLETCNPSSGCVAGTPLLCDNRNVCDGIESCDPQLGCQRGTELVCDDEDACNGLETCDPQEGCQPGTEMVCDDGDVCNGIETCDPELGCQDGEPLICQDDPNTCTDETCDPVTGCPDRSGLRSIRCCTGPYDCVDDLSCTDNRCVAGICIVAIMHFPCCEIDEDCSFDTDPCTKDFCVPTNSYSGIGLCQRLHAVPPGCCQSNTECANLAPDVCTIGECVSNKCKFRLKCEETPVDDLCTENRCNNGRCLPPILIKCDDGIDCTSDVCDPLRRCVYTDISCTSTNPCIEASCHKGECKYKNKRNCRNKTENGDEQMAAEEESDLLLDAYPNPFSNKLNIEFTLPEDSRVKLEIYNISGQRLATLFEGEVKAAELQTLEYNPGMACDCMFIYRLQTEQGSYYGKAVMVR